MSGGCDRGLWGRADCGASPRASSYRGISVGVSRPPVNGVASAGAGRPPVKRGAASDSRSRDTAVLMAMQAQKRVMLRTLSRPVHKETTATAAAARRSEAGEAVREHRPAWNARGFSIATSSIHVYSYISPLNARALAASWAWRSGSKR
jgi:hypothetical protein